MTISTPPTAPARTDPLNFSVRMDTYLAWIGTDLVPGLNAFSGVTNSGTFTDGNAAGPGVTFTSDTDTGMYRASSNTLGFATAGVQRVTLNTTLLDCAVASSFAKPASFWSATGSYMAIGSVSAPLGSIATEGSNAVDITSNGYRHTDGFWRSFAAGGGTGAAQIRLQPDGAISLRADDVKADGSSANPTEVAKVKNAQFLTAAGSASAPSYSWIADTNTGFYRSGADNLDMATAGIAALKINAAQAVVAVGTGGLGYGAGAGGTVTQATSRTTGVTINNPTGAITLFSAAGSTTATTFTVTNSKVDATDTVVISQKSGTNLYLAFVTAVAAGSFNITFYTTGGTATDAPVFNFAVIKGATA